MKRNGNTITFGARPLTFDISKPFVVSNVSDYSNVQSYYDTPARYFNILSGFSGIKVETVQFSAPGQMIALTEKARILNSTSIGTRVYSYDDYSALKEWLIEDEDNKAVLFHSYSYPYGYLLMEEFPLQTTFDDINPILI